MKRVCILLSDDQIAYLKSISEFSLSGTIRLIIERDRASCKRDTMYSNSEIGNNDNYKQLSIFEK